MELVMGIDFVLIFILFHENSRIRFVSFLVY